MSYLMDPGQAPPLRWGILGTGSIATKVCESIRAATVQELAAVGSRTLDRALDFAAEFDIPASHGSYEDLVEDPDVDVIYVATPNSEHYAHAMLALEAGKHVLVEKSFALNQAQAREIVDLAASRKLFCMEAMWTRFLPHHVELRRLVQEGEIGELVTAVAPFGARNEFDPESRFFSPRLGGGSLLDMGIYSVSWIVDLFGEPGTIQARGELTTTGVDALQSAILGYPARGAHAVAQSTIAAPTPQDAWIAGTDGFIRVTPQFWAPASLTITHRDGTTDEWFEDVIPHGYQYEIAEVARRITNGETFSPLMTPEQSVTIMGVLDEIRRQVGFAFPGE
jgi:predicted dehydrogenase